MGWICSCGEGLEDSFDVCWNCNRSRPGGHSGNAAVAGNVAAGVSTAAPKHTSIRLLPGESALASMGGDGMVLTTHRLRYRREEFGRTALVSLMLDELASFALTSLTKPILLVIGLVIGVVSLLLMSISFKGGGYGCVITACFVFAYLLTQRRVLAFGSAGAAIEYVVADMSEDECRDFLERVEHAKNNRYLRRDA